MASLCVSLSDHFSFGCSLSTSHVSASLKLIWGELSLHLEWCQLVWQVRRLDIDGTPVDDDAAPRAWQYVGANWRRGEMGIGSRRWCRYWHLARDRRSVARANAEMGRMDDRKAELLAAAA